MEPDHVDTIVGEEQPGLHDTRHQIPGEARRGRVHNGPVGRAGERSKAVVHADDVVRKVLDRVNGELDIDREMVADRWATGEIDDPVAL